MRIQLQSRSLQSEQGSSLVEVAIVVPTLLFVLLALVDFGRGYYLAMEVAGAARAGAIYGSQNRTDTTGITNAVKDDAPDVSGISASSISWGCECPDGSNASVSCTSAPSCTTNVVYYVKVTASATYTTMIPWKGIPSTIALSSTSEMRSFN